MCKYRVGGEGGGGQPASAQPACASGEWVWVCSKFNGTSTPKGSYRAKTGDNDYNVNSSRHSLSTALCESIRYQAKSE